jgi:hypothetical protein
MQAGHPAGRRRRARPVSVSSVGMASVSQMVLFPNEADVDEEEEVNLDEFHRDAWDLDEDFILQQHAK